MKHDDTTLQAAIDAAMHETRKNNSCKSLAACKKSWPKSWRKESPARLALAKAFLAKLPEAQPILADDGRSLGQVAKEAFIGAPGLTDDWMNAAAQAVAAVVLAQAIRRLESVPVDELKASYWQGQEVVDRCVGFERVRARLIAAACDEAVGINGLTREEEAMTASVVGLTKAMSDPGVSDVEQFHGISSDMDKAQDALRYISETFDAMGIPSVSDDGQSLSCEQRADMALTKLTASAPRQECVLRPLPEAGPVPDGCVRLTTYKSESANCGWLIGEGRSTRDTHFADIRIPSTETPAPVNEQPKQQVPLGPEDVPPGSVFSVKGPRRGYCTAGCVDFDGCNFPTRRPHFSKSIVGWKELADDWQINRSIPMTGKWDANAWEPCYKLI